MAFKFIKKRWQRIVVISLGAAIALVLLLGLVINIYWSPILASEVKKVVAKSSDGLYKADFSSAELHILRGKIVIFNIVLKLDTAVYNQKLKLHLAPNNLIELRVKRLILTHVHPFRLYFKHKLDIGEVILNQPELNVSYQLNHTRDTTSTDHRTTWQKISKTLRSIHIKSIVLSDVKLKYQDYSGNKLATSELRSLNLSATDLLIDSATQSDKTRLLYCRDILAELSNYNGTTPSGLYKYKVRSLTLSTLSSQLNVQGFVMQPVREDIFFKKSQADRFSINIDTLQLNNFDFLNYHKYRMLTASSLILKSGTFEVFTNPNKKQDKKTDKVKTFPNVLIHQLYTALELDTIKVHHINVNYLEYNPRSNKTGTLTFDNTEGQFLNVTTKKDILAKNNISTVALSTYFMNRGKLDISFAFNLTDNDVSYSYRGHLGPMDLRVMNKAIAPLAMVRIKSGTVKSFDFDVRGNSEISRGRVAILYNNLAVNLLKSDTINDKLKKMTIASLFANIFIIKHNNPDTPGVAPRTFNVVYHRPISTPFFKTQWQTLLSGLKPSAGLDEKTTQATKARLTEHAINKQNRLLKKERRKLRRKEKERRKREEEQTPGGEH